MNMRLGVKLCVLRDFPGAMPMPDCMWAALCRGGFMRCAEHAADPRRRHLRWRRNSFFARYCS